MARSGVLRLKSMAIHWLVPRSAAGRDWPRSPSALLAVRPSDWEGDWAGHLQMRSVSSSSSVLRSSSSGCSGELKGGAMKFGQALSLFESVLPEDVAAPYRAHLARLQDAAPPMPTSRVHAVLAREFGPRWRESFSDFDPLPAAAASIGQVHQATWADGRTVAVKVQYPGADEALRSDLRQIGRLSKVFAPLAGGMDVSALVDELTARVTEELDYTLEAASQQQAAIGFAGSEEFCVPPVLASTPKVMVSEWVEGAPLSSAANLPDDERNAAALQYVTIPLRWAKRGRFAARRPSPRKFQAHEGWPAGSGRLRLGGTPA